MPRTTHVCLQSGADPGVITRTKRRIFDETLIARSDEICAEKVSFFSNLSCYSVSACEFNAQAIR